MTVNAILTKPLDGKPEGSEREFSQADFDRLEAMGAVKAAPVAADPEPAETPATKADPVLENKMEAAPANKARGKRNQAA